MAGQNLQSIFDDIDPPAEGTKPPVLPNRSLFDDLDPPPLTNIQKAEQYANDSTLGQYLPSLPRGWPGRAAANALTGIPDALMWAAHQSRRLGLTPDQFKQLEPPPYLTPQLTEAADIPQMPADAGYPQQIAEGVAASVLGGPRPAMPAIPTTAARTLTGRLAPVAGEVAASTGGVVGADVAKRYGYDETLGGLLGAMVPGGVNRLVGTANRSFLAAPDSADRIATLDRTGIPVSPGLVGNRGMSRIENTAASLPLVGRVANARQRAQFEAFQNATYDEAGNLRGVPYYEHTVPSEGGIGVIMRRAAETGLESLTANERAQYDAFFTQPEVQGVNVRPTEIRQEGQNVVGRESAPTIRAVQESIATDIDPIATAPYDPTTPIQGPQLPEAIPIEQYRRTRTDIGADTRQGRGLNAGEQSQMYNAVTRDIERELMNHPAMQRAFPNPYERQAQLERLRTLDAEYRAAHAKTGSRFDGRDVETLERFASTPSDAGVFRFGSEPDTMEVLRRNAPPGEVLDIASQTILNKAGMTNPIEGINISPLKLAQWWNGMDDTQRMAMVGGNMRAFNTLRDLAESGDIFRNRSTAINASQTAPTLATMSAAGGLLSEPVGTLGLLGSGLGIATLSSSEPFARQLARTDPEWNRILARRAANAAIMQGGSDKAGPR